MRAVGTEHGRIRGTGGERNPSENNRVEIREACLHLAFFCDGAFPSQGGSRSAVGDGRPCRLTAWTENPGLVSQHLPVALLTDIAEAKGRPELYARQSPPSLKVLRETALFQ